jgi:hypothetical protein
MRKIDVEKRIKGLENEILKIKKDANITRAVLVGTNIILALHFMLLR